MIKAIRSWKMVSIASKEVPSHVDKLRKPRGPRQIARRSDIVKGARALCVIMAVMWSQEGVDLSSFERTWPCDSERCSHLLVACIKTSLARVFLINEDQRGSMEVLCSD